MAVKIWKPGPGGGTPITADALNEIEVKAEQALTKATAAVTPEQLTQAVANSGGLTTAQADKLNGISTGATKNATDAVLTARANHTGEQGISTITGLQKALDDAAASGPNGAGITAADRTLLDQLVVMRESQRNYGIFFDEFGDATTSDQAKWNLAMDFYRNDRKTYRPTLLMGARKYTLTSMWTPFNYFGMQGVERIGNAEKGDGAQGTRIKLTIGTRNSPNAWINPTGDELFNLSIRDIAFEGGTGTRWMAGTNPSSPTVLWCMHLNNVSFTGFRSVMGHMESTANDSKAFMNLCLIDGWFSTNNCYTGAMHIGGSDNSLFMGMTNIDSNTAYLDPANAILDGDGKVVALGHPHLWLNSMGKTTIGNIYMTADGDWRALKVTGSGRYGGPVTFLPGARFEGRNRTAACKGAPVQIQGGQTVFQNSWFGYSGKNPTGVMENDKGHIMQTAGDVILDGCFYEHSASGPGAQLEWPLVYTTGGRTIASKNLLGSGDAGYPANPRFRQAGSGEVIILDSLGTKLTA